MTTYYPAPKADFDRITITPQILNLNAVCQIGTLSVDSASGYPYFCKDNSGAGKWRLLDNVWEQTGQNVYPIGTLPPSAGPNNILVGIGTSAPAFKLTLQNDGGILATGTFGAGALSSLVGFNCITVGGRTCPSPVLEWSPRHASFYAGGISTTAFADDTYMDDYSVSLGSFELTPNNPALIATTSSGANNILSANYATIAGGLNNTVSGEYSVITGGSTSMITSTSDYSVISGSFNRIEEGNYNTIAGGRDHHVKGSYMTIGAGQNNDTTSADVSVIETEYSIISGGKDNLIRTGTVYSTISGGMSNSILGSYNTISGGTSNFLQGLYAYIAGGANNNNIAALENGDYTAIGGGSGNTASGNWSTILGGESNMATGDLATILGGKSNNASGKASVIAGGLSNRVSGNYSGAVGNSITVFGDHSFAFGRNMNLSVDADRTFVWGVSEMAVNVTTANSFIIPIGTDVDGGLWIPFFSLGETRINTGTADVGTVSLKNTTAGLDYLAVTANSISNPGNIFIVKSSTGFVGIGEDDPAYPLEFGTQANGAYLTEGGVWTSTSSREYKNNIAPFSSEEAHQNLQKLRPVTYNYRSNPNEHHAGFIAEDVPSLVGTEEKDSVDVIGVTAILTSVLQNQQSQIIKQEKDLTELNKEIESLKSRLDRQ